MKNTVSRWICCLVATMMVAGVLTPAVAADADKEAKREMRRVQAQLAAALKEKAALATQVDALKKQLGETESKGAALEKKSGGQRKQVAELSGKYEDADKNLQQMTQLYSQISESQQQLRMEKEQEHKRLEEGIRVCEKKNAELYQISVELMEKYQSKGIISSLLQAEPFTQLEKVRVQNLLQEYLDKADAAKIASGSVSAVTATGNAVAANDASAGASGSNVPINGSVPTTDSGNSVQDVPHP